jgi:hypothetical protein
MNKTQTPYLSLVVTSRNDNHGGDMTKRMRIFVNGLIHQTNKYKVLCELIMVEWNPPVNEKLLHEVLPQAGKEDYLTIRYIQVPAKEHQKLAFSDRLSIFQMIAKNVGIRRAKADFVLCTNIDLLFSDELFERIAKKDFKRGEFYRANRCDVPSDIDEGLSTKEQLAYAEKNILQRLGKNSMYPNFSNTSSFLFRFKICYPVFKRLSKLKTFISKPESELYNTLDLDACGDFTLMSKEDWIKIQVYPELEVYSLHIDSMALFAAAAAGIKPVTFPAQQCTYHISHKGGWEFQTKKEKLLFYVNKPVLDWWAVYELGMELLKNKESYNINAENWGLADVALNEIIIG